MTELLEKDLVYKIIGCAMKVHKELGHGLREKTYERGMCVEFVYKNINFNQQKKYPVYYRGEIIDEFIPDLVVEKRIVVEIKTVVTISDEHRGRLLNYLRVTGLIVGLIINFNHTKLQWERFVLETAR
ncbi:MAG: GxxExxY protein [Candidatus Marinimicrobia bacterium]|nr:GxxExxY protein [Candidatus Neomarinimicrobiota bacterium]